VYPWHIRYAQCLATKLLVTNVEPHIKLIRHGLRDVRGAIPKFRALAGWRALQSALLGSLAIDVAEWRQAVDTSHRGVQTGDRRTETTLAFFWAAVGKLTSEDRRKLLFFWTAESPPAAGLAHLDRRLTLRVDTSLTANQPRAATCFYSLEIPVLATQKAATRLVRTCVAHWNSWGQE
jgi:hypothetical protein